MKKISLILLSVFVTYSSANAEVKIYGGIDAQVQMLNLKTKKAIVSTGGGNTNLEPDTYYDKDTLAPAVFLGLDVADALKIEVGYSRKTANQRGSANTGLYYDSETNPVAMHSQIKSEEINLDFKPYKKFDDALVYGIIGVTHYKFAIKESYIIEGSTYKGVLFSQESETKNVISPSIGVGVEYTLTPSIFARVQGKYNFMNTKFDNFTYGLNKIQGAATFGLGIGAYFF